MCFITHLGAYIDVGKSSERMSIFFIQRLQEKTKEQLETGGSRLITDANVVLGFGCISNS